MRMDGDELARMDQTVETLKCTHADFLAFALQSQTNTNMASYNAVQTFGKKKV